MINILIALSTIVAAFGLGRYITFTSNEGKDERGRSILTKSSHITVSFLFIVYAIIILIVGFLNISANMLGLIIVMSLSMLILLNSLSIMYYRKKI